GIIKFLSRAKSAAQEKNLQELYNNLHRASKIIDGLHGCLDPVKGGEVTKALDRFYNTMFVQVLSLNSEKDITKFDNVIKEFKIMLDAWREVDIKVQSNNNDSSDSVGLSI